MSDKPTGGSAFPSKKRVYRAGYATNEFEPVDGMPLRDYFAAKAMQGLLTNEAMPFDTKGKTLKDFLARAAYDYADAMLEARK